MKKPNSQTRTRGTAAQSASGSKTARTQAAKKTAKKTARESSKQSAKGSANEPVKASACTRSQETWQRHSGFPVVGIGASAGGLEALQTLFEHVPADAGIGFVVVTHLHPGHTSMLPELLGKVSQMPVCEAKDGARVEPSRVYVCPPGGQLDILNGALQQMELSKDEPPHLPIDHFLRSLAADQRKMAICIILSGTGTDGTQGLKEIKAQSGMAMVQRPETAKYAGMPSSAVGTGLADYVLAPEEMAEQLLAYARGPYVAQAGDAHVEVPAEPLRKIFVLLRSRTGHDFSGYKANTIQRRIERRMNVHQVEGPHQYVRYLQENPHELDILFKELLISVTSFFRDPEAYDAMRKAALPGLLKTRPENYTLRAWVPGCASGEEVYSLAILLRECFEELKCPMEAQVFGTDLDSEAIDVARAGQYPDGTAMDVVPARLERYFVRQDGGYRIRKDIREMAVFAVQNVIKDPPFTKLDLISCRNLLIYLDTEMQQKLLPVFHYALKPGGLLFLGPSESIGSHTELFELLDKRWKIYRRKESTLAVHTLLEFPSEPRAVPPMPDDVREAPHAAREGNVGTIVERLLLKRHAPPSVVVNERGDVVYIHGRTGQFLEPAAGQPRLNVHDMARPGLELELALALRQAARSTTEITREEVRVQTNGEQVCIDLNVVRIAEPEALRGLFLVTFRTRPVSKKPSPRKRARARGGDARVQQLERELQYTRESLQTTIEELETSNEELKSTNEELQSTNEELQSTNEELETSKEEMQSLNEELTTVNTELHSKVEELSRANDDMQNLLNSTEIATIFLDRELHIKRYTQQVKKLMNLISTDVGRPLADLASSLSCDSLVDDCREVLRTLVSNQTEVCTRDGHWYLMRIMPYRTADNVIDGLVLTFVDINPIKLFERELSDARERVAIDLDAVTHMLELGTRFVRDGCTPEVLDDVLVAAMLVTKADKGTVQLVDPECDALKTVIQRGFGQGWAKVWDSVCMRADARMAQLRAGQRVIVTDTASDPLADDEDTGTLYRQGELRGFQSSPLLSESGELLGVLSTHFAVPRQPHEHGLRLLDVLTRQTAEILERSRSGLVSHDPAEADGVR